MSQRRENDSPEAREAKLSELVRAYATAILAGDEIAAELTIRDALEARLTTAEIDDAVIAPALWLVGDLWRRGEISVADEHVATEISIRVLALQREAQRTIKERAGSRVLLATPAGEQHVVALRMVANLLRDAGFDVLMLGADVPAQALAAAARRHEPDVICMSATMPGGADRVLICIHEVTQRWHAAGFVVGGRGVRQRMRSRPGVDVCERVSDVVEAVDAIVKRADLN
jgi:methanogenic corrinoid protein MtbC1